MKYKIIIILILELLLFQACNVKHTDISDQSHQETFDMMKGLEFAIKEAPYCALIQYTGVNVVPFPDDEPEGTDQSIPPDVAVAAKDEKQIYHARVLETFRGQHLEKISYVLICEKGEYASEHASIVGKKSVVTLCLDNEGFWYPGTGSKFPATEEIIKAARRISQEVKFVKQSFPYCE